MKLQDWQQIYPTASLHTSPTEDAAFLSLSVESGFLWIPKHQLSPSEERLLTTLNQAERPQISIEEHPWYPALFQGKPAPTDHGRFRLIQVEFKGLNPQSKEGWNQEIKSILPFLTDYFFVSETNCLLVEAYQEDALSADELQGLFLALDGDFDLYTRLFVGTFYPFDCHFTQLLQEEHELFVSEAKRNTQLKCFNLGQAVVHFFADHTTTTSYMMQAIHNVWFEDDFPEIILALWANQGNVSSTAKTLFMHRNTLQYKIEKFQKHTITNLKDMNELFLCYLLIVSFQVN